MAKPFEQEVLLDANGKPLFDAVDTLARKIESIQKTITKIQQDSFKSAKDFNATIDANVKALQRAQSQMRTLSQQDANERRRLRALADADARQSASKLGTGTTSVGYQFERERALEALRNANNEKQRIAALQQLELANARVRAIQAIEREEANVTRQIKQQNSVDSTTSQRARLALARANAQESARSLGTEEALSAAKVRQTQAERSLASATAITRKERIDSLAVANAELRALERMAAVERRNAAAGGGGGGPSGPDKPSRLQNILTPGYAAAAFARTAVYGGAALAAYGAFNAAQSELSGAVKLEDEFARLQAISNSTDTQMQSLKGSILGVAEASRFSVEDIIKMSQTLAQAGVSAGDMKDVLEAVNALATASGSTPDEAVNLVTSALGSFQLNASEATRVANLMTEALNRTRLTVQQVGQAIQYVGATAYEQNISLEQLLATIGSVAQAGVRSGSTIGTGFRQFLVDLLEPSKKLSTQLKLLGLSAADVDVSVRGLPAVLDTLKKAGFGAAQAYEGLEKRAAAFYLVAKNNTDIADKLQLSFAYTNASIVAQERAMNSLAAQWQRFKNILQITIAGGLGETITTLKNLIAQIADRIQEMNRIAEEERARQAKGRSAYSSNLDYAAHYDLMPAAKQILEAALNGPNIGFAGAGTNTGIGSWLRRLGEDTNGATDASEKLATQIANTEDQISKYSGSVGEADKEIIRLITQKESLHDNDVRSAAETATLTTRFVGLANQLVVTGNRYDDLLNAARRYRVEQLRLLGISLQVQQSQTSSAAHEARSTLNANIAAAQNSSVISQLTPQERAALGSLGTSGVQTQEFSRALGVLTAAIERLRTKGIDVTNLQKVIGPAGTLAQNVSQFNTIGPQLGSVLASQTDLGQQLTNQSQEVTSLIERMQSQPNGGPEKADLTKQANGLLDAMTREINAKLPLNTGANANFLRSMASDVASFHNQVKALNTATDDEVAAAKKAAREKEKAEREAARGPRLTQALFDQALRELSGRALGSGPRTKAEEDALHAAGRTRATGATSAHSTGGIVRDIPAALSKEEGDRLAQTIRQGLKARFGIDFYVKFETGVGRNQGTGPHVHAQATPGARVKPSATSADDEFKFAAKLDQSQLELDRANMAEQLKALSHATTKEAFDATVIAAAGAMKKVNEDLMNVALNELATGGVAYGSPEYQAKIEQVKQSIAQNMEQFQRLVTDALAKSVDAQFKAAEAAFEAAIRPSENVLSIMQGSAAGLDRYSLRGQVTDSARQLADARIAQAQEAANRARLTALPNEISTKQAALANYQTQANSGLLDTDHLNEVNLKIIDLTNNIAGLQTTRANLEAQFGAEGLLPKTLGEGLDQAIAAYKEMHNLNLSWTQMLNGEMLGAIETVSGALTTMFTSIIDGSQNALQAIASFAKAILAAIVQIVAKIIATKIIQLLLSVFGSIAGSSGALPVDTGASTTLVSPGVSLPGLGGYFGTAIPGFAGGGRITRGHSMRDSSLARVAKGEWIVRKSAVDSVGQGFMSNLNKNGAKALEASNRMPAISLESKPEINVWMVKPDEKPQMGPNDVLVTWQNDVLSGGESRRLIKRVSQDSM